MLGGGVAAKLAQKVKNPIVLFDLRGHSSSLNEAKGQGSIVQDAKDIIGLTKKLGYDKANFIGHSYGANIAIKLANSYPEIASNIVLYEPPVLNLLFDKPEYKDGLSQSMALLSNSISLLENGEIEQGIQLFIENMAFGKNSWKELLNERTKSTMLANYPTFLDQAKDKERLYIKVAQLNAYKGAVIILHGTESLVHFGACVKEIAQLLEKEQLIPIKGASHSGVFTHANSIALKIFELLIEEKN
ncbi:MAG: alpha/beta fold hydrolase [Aureispira sp.]